MRGHAGDSDGSQSLDSDRADGFRGSVAGVDDEEPTQHVGGRDVADRGCRVQRLRCERIG